MGTDVRGQIGPILDEYRRLAAALERLRTDVAGVTGTACSAGGAIRATAGTHGELVDLWIDDNARHRLAGHALAAAVVEAAGRAAASVRERVRMMVAASLPERFAASVGPGGQLDLSRLLSRDPTDLGDGGR